MEGEGTQEIGTRSKIVQANSFYNNIPIPHLRSPEIQPKAAACPNWTI